MTPNRKFQFVAVAAAFGIGLAVGAVVKISTHSGHENPGMPAGGSFAQNTVSAVGSPEATGKNAKLATDATDFPTLLHEALRETDRSKRWMSLQAVAYGVDPSKIREALVEVQSLSGVKEKKALIRTLLLCWGEGDPKSAIAYAQGLANALERNEAMPSLIYGWAEKDSAAAWQWIAQAPGDFKDSLYPAVIGAIAQSDPKAAMQLAASLPQGGGRSRILHEAISNWALQDFDAAFGYLNQMPEGDDKNTVRSAVISMTSQRYPDKALLVAQQMPPGDTRDNALDIVAQSLARRDLQAAIAWANQQTDERVKNAIWLGIVIGTSQSDGARAAALAQLLPTGESRTDAMRCAVANWAVNDPGAAAAWVSRMDDSKDKTGAMMAITEFWVRDDIAGATRWVQSLPAGNEKDEVLLRACDSPLQDSPATAAQWAAAISDETKRFKAMENVAQAWMKNYPSAASQWISGSSLPAATKTRLLQQK